MAIKKTAKKRAKKQALKFNKRLVLNQYLLSLLGVKSFEDLAIYVNKMENEGLTEDRVSRFHHAVVQALPISGAELTADALLAYDDNIVSHTLAIQGKRPAPITWKYFQYLGLLFTEIYLDRYMNQRENLLEALNAYRIRFNTDKSAADQIEPYVEDDLSKIAFWSATGSGKTLLMHLNIKQYLHHLNKAGRTRELNRILLVTPNEGLSTQHKQEFDESGIYNDRFSKESTSLFAGQAVEIIEITKLGDKDGDQTVSVDSFEGNNLVLVDEGHRGSSGVEWSKRRRKLAANGFTFEYSATFGQAVGKDKILSQEYAKCILFDYSYRYFYMDGYGKDYRIMNLQEDGEESDRELYLTACLLSFYQQKILFKDPRSEVKHFGIENPLWVFVGGSVNAVRTQNSRQVSDVVDMLLFLGRYTHASNRSLVIERIARAISGDTGLLNTQGQDIFANMFPHLVMLQTPEQIYEGTLKEIFNASGSATIHVEELKGADGEIALKLGENDPFGVINVGDSGKLCKLCDEHEELIVSEKTISSSLFHGINKPDSSINILIGSKKFTEGWSSWRVSTMGLMNIGKKEGSQIIQLFGRGVRLKGFQRTLKRHTGLHEQGIEKNDYLSKLETLNIFGVRADYMQQFKEYLEDEGVPSGDNFEEIILPVIPNLGTQKLKLKTVRLKEGLDYKRQGEKPTLQSRGERKIGKVILDYYPRIQSFVATDIRVEQAQAIKNTSYFKPEHIAFLDMDALYFELQRFKNERAWFNLNLSKEEIEPILLDRSWYEILIPQDQLTFNRFDKILLWQNIAGDLLKKYCDRYYKSCKDEWEAPNREYRELDLNDPNFFPEYKLLIERSQETIIKQLQAIKLQLESGTIPTADLTFRARTCISIRPPPLPATALRRRWRHRDQARSSEHRREEIHRRPAEILYRRDRLL